MSHSEALIMFVLLLPTQYTPTPTVSLTSAEYRKHNTEREYAITPVTVVHSQRVTGSTRL